MARNKYDIDENLYAPFSFSQLKRSFKYVKRQSKLMISAFVLSTIGMLAALTGPRLMAAALDNYVPKGDVHGLVTNTLLMALTILINVIMTTICARLMTIVGQNIIHDIRMDLFEHLQYLSFSYYDSRPGGKILVRIINYVNSVSDMLSNGIINFLLQICNLVFITVFMLSLNFKMGLIILGGLPLVAIVILSLKTLQRKGWQAYSNKSSNVNAYLNESIVGMRITQLFTRENINKGIFDRLSKDLRSSWYKAVLPSNAVGPAVEIVSQFVVAALYGISVLCFVPTVQFGVILAMAIYADRFWQPITQLANIYNTFMNNIAYLERIFETIDEPIEIADLPESYPLPQITGNVEFSHVTFEYEKGAPVLSDVSFSVKAGESIALVGPTGAGKSTIVNLLCRFYDTTEGSVLVDGHDVGKVTIKSLRSQMGIMLQDSFIFSDSIAGNIRYGKLDATDKEIETSAETVCASEFIEEMEKGYDTQLLERGSRLSQGQKQLVSFARTLASNPKILILDEATSSIDTKTERQLQTGLARMLKGRTSFIIAHRLSTIKSCDRIMYIDAGRIAESGSHDELMAKKGLYYKLYTSQQ